MGTIPLRLLLKEFHQLNFWNPMRKTSASISSNRSIYGTANDSSSSSDNEKAERKSSKNDKKLYPPKQLSSERQAQLSQEVTPASSLVWHVTNKINTTAPPTGER